MGENGGLTVVSSFHVKGGCGKTTVLSSLGVTLAYFTSMRTTAVDMDIQGALYATLLGKEPQRFSPQERHRYYEALMQGFNPANTRYPGVNQRLSVAHYPLEMFANDKFSQSSYVKGFEQVVTEAAKNSGVLLLDLPPGRLSTSDVAPFTSIDHLVDQYCFIIPSRPVPKEIKDGKENYFFVRQMLVAEGIDPKKLRGIPILNFDSVRISEDEQTLIRTIQDGMRSLGQNDSDLDFESSAYKVKSSFPDKRDTLDEEQIKHISIPQVPRSKSDMLNYCVLLDESVDLDFLEDEISFQNMKAMGELSYDNIEEVYDRLEEVDKTYGGREDMMVAHLEFLRSMALIGTAVFRNKPEICQELHQRAIIPRVKSLK